MYLTDPIPPRMYGMLKAHNKSKNYLMRIVVSTIGTLSHGISKYLVDLIQPTLNKNPIRVQYSTSFILKAKANVRFHTMWWLSTLRSPYRKQGITGTIASDWKSISKQTNLSLLVVTKMIEACL